MRNSMVFRTVVSGFVVSSFVVSGMRRLFVASGFELLAKRAIGALSGRRARDLDLLLADARRRIVLVMRQAVAEEVDVVALVVAVEALMGTAGLGAGQRRMRHGVGDIELEA